MLSVTDLEEVRQVLPSKFLFIRHAESSWNARGLWQGQCDPGLSDKGFSELPVLWEQTQRQFGEIEWIFSSDLKRALWTAHFLVEKSNARLWSSKHFRERHAGDWSGKSKAEFSENHRNLMLSIQRGSWLIKPPNGENRLDVMKRVAAGLLEGGEKARENITFALVSHLGVLRTLIPGAELENAHAGWVRICQDRSNLTELFSWEPFR